MTVPVDTSTWLDALPHACAMRLQALGQVESFATGDSLIAQGLSESHAFLIEEGEVVFLADDEGHISLGTGELVAVGYLDYAQRGNDIVATRPTRVRRFQRAEFLNAFASDEAAQQAILEAATRLQTKRLTTRAATSGSARTSAREFVAGLVQAALTHRAVRHPYLQALGEGSLPDTRWALADFARHYFGYSSNFPRYLTAVMSRLENPGHRSALLGNLMEESGVYEEDEFRELAVVGVHPEWIEGVAHPALFRRFSEALGVHHSLLREADQVVCWRELFLQLLANGTPAEALGALGLGTENIVRSIYAPFVRAIRRLPELSARDTVFFPLHTAVDDHHQATLQAISEDLADSDEGKAGLRRGMLKALQLRSAFWDWLYERALDPANAEEVI